METRLGLLSGPIAALILGVLVAVTLAATSVSDGVAALLIFVALAISLVIAGRSILDS